MHIIVFAHERASKVMPILFGRQAHVVIVIVFLIFVALLPLIICDNFPFFVI
jgi:hypothetical protein